MRFAATRRWKMTVEGLTNKGKNSSVGLVQSKGKLLPSGTREIFRAIVNGVQCVSEWPAHRHHPSLPLSLSASRCQLAPPVPSPLAHELLHAAAALPIAAESAGAAARSSCPGYPVPSSLYVAATSAPAQQQPTSAAALITPLRRYARHSLSPSAEALPSPLRESSRLFYLSSPPPGN
jgi:hypothetical protein